MRRYGSPVRCGFWHGMSRYGTPEVVRYVSLCFAMFRSLLRLGPPALSRRRRSSRLRDVALCRALSRAGDLRRSRPPLQWNRCRFCCVVFALSPLSGGFSVGEGRVPGAGARIRAGKGSVRALGVPVRVAVGVPGALSHIFSESRGVLRVLRESCAPPGSAFGRLCVPFMPRYGAYLSGSIGSWWGVPVALSRRDPRRGRVTRRGDIGDMPGRALVVGRRGSGPGERFDEGGRRAGLE